MIDDLLKAHHDHPIHGHLGPGKMKEKLQRRYYWQHMDADIRKYYQSCDSCQQTKTPRNRPRIPRSTLPAVWRPFQRMGVDFLSVTESDKGNTKVLVFTDYLTRYVEAFAVAN